MIDASTPYGTLVRLKGSSHVQMVTGHIAKQSGYCYVTCYWLTSKGKNQSHIFDSRLLEFVPKEKPDIV